MKKRNSNQKTESNSQKSIESRSFDTAPKKLSLEEWQEIMQVREVKEGWGLDDETDPVTFGSMVYGAKFNFVTGGPGYVGDLYILQGDSLERPMRLIRQRGRLEPIAEGE